MKKYRYFKYENARTKCIYIFRISSDRSDPIMFRNITSMVFDKNVWLICAWSESSILKSSKEISEEEVFTELL